MPLRLHLTVVRSRPLFRLGLRRFCCHDACTSWCFALVRCFARAANGESTALLCRNSLRSAEKMRHIHGGTLPSTKLCIHSYWRFSPSLICSWQMRFLVRTSTTRPSVKMRLPFYLRESFIHSIRSPVSTRRGCCFPQVMPFPI